MPQCRFLSGSCVFASVPFLVCCRVAYGQPFLEDGTYTIVNKASGRRIFASTSDGLFNTVDDSGPIYHEQMWLFAPQVDQSYAIINAANGLRLFAQSGMDGSQGFYAVSTGPIYQDQKWRFLPQSDGSYAIANAKSSRRILARAGEPGQFWFAAVADSGPIRGDETWWLINQEKDSTSRVLVELQLQQNLTSKLAVDYSVAKNETTYLALQLQNERFTNADLLEKIEAQNVLVARAKQERKNKASCMRERDQQVQAASDTIERLRSESNAAQASNTKLAAAIEVHREGQTRLEKTLRVEQQTVATLSKEVDTKSAEASRLNRLVEEQSLLDCSSACAPITTQVARLSNQTIGTMLGMMAIVFAICVKHNQRVVGELNERRIQTAQLESELEAEVSGMLKVGESGDGLGVDFGFQIIDSDVNGEMVRYIKIQCPGVDHADVEVELITNGCSVSLQRSSSCGLDATAWKKRFQFRQSEGMFEFKEDQMQLEKGFLLLVFRRYSPQTRMIRFPHHFNLSSSDADQRWEYASDDGSGELDEADAWWHQTQPAVDPKGAPSSRERDSMSTASTARAAP